MTHAYTFKYWWFPNYSLSQSFPASAHRFKTVLLSLSFSHTEGTCSWIGVGRDCLGQGSPLESGSLITAAQLSFTLVMHAVDSEEWYYGCHQFCTHSPLDYLPQQRDHDTTTYPGEKGRKNHITNRKTEVRTFQVI